MTYEEAYRISIVMPTYNRAGYILETIDSILAQSYTNWELLILDDGSEDDTENVVSTIKDRRICFYKCGRIGINGKIKNTGLRYTTGKLIAFMDSDDLWPPDKLGKQVAALLANPEAGFSFTNGFDFADTPVPGNFFYKKREGAVCGQLFTTFCYPGIGIRTPTVMFWKHCLEKTGYFNENRVFTDYSFFGKLAFHYKCVALYEPLLKRRLHAANNINANWKEDYEEHIETIKDFYRKGWLSYALLAKALYGPYLNLGERCLSSGKWDKAIFSFFRAWIYKPLNIIPLKKIMRTIFAYTSQK